MPVMRVPLVAANWKMHGSRSFVTSFFNEFSAGVAGVDVEVVVFPPAVYLDQAIRESAGGNVAGTIAIGAQNVSHEAEGAFTGEVAAQMVADIGCSHVLVGHSERRQLYGESDQIVAAKFVAALESDLVPVLCVGESLSERESGETLSVVGRQLKSVIDVAGLEKVAAAVIAYEPVWAIGTGVTATPEQAQEVHGAIREMLGEPGQKTRILYGGSVKAANADALFSQPDIDGGLVGGASLNAEEFSAICKKAHSS